jgi:hypothetical protein
MEHNLFMTLSDNTVVTYSDIKEKADGTEYVTIYFETPDEKDGFHSMDIEYPDGKPEHIKGYSREEIDHFLYHYNKVGDVIFEDAKEDLTYA